LFHQYRVVKANPQQRKEGQARGSSVSEEKNR